jgi:hypothetical protein
MFPTTNSPIGAHRWFLDELGDHLAEVSETSLGASLDKPS